jgi:hypothetical protein
MDVDELLGSAGLPDVPVGTDEALARTLERGRARQRRRRALAAAAAVVTVAGLAVTAVSVTGDDGQQVQTAQQGTTTATAVPPATGGTATIPAEPEPGDDATWTIDPARPPTADSSTFTALVMRAGCNGGQTGQVLRPGIEVGDTEVIVTFTVERMEGVATCQGNDTVPYEVDLGEPLGDRQLVDGICRKPSMEGSAAYCTAEGPYRWPEPQGKG